MIRHIRTNIVMAGATAVLVAGLAAGVFAQGRRGPGGPGPDGPGMGMRFGGPMGPGGLPLGQLDLSDAQRSQVRDIMQRYQADMMQAGKKEGDARAAQRKAIETVPLNEGLIRSTTQALSSTETDQALIQARIYNDLWQILTSDQQKKATDIQARRESMIQQREQQMDQRRQQRQQRGKV